MNSDTKFWIAFIIICMIGISSFLYLYWSLGDSESNYYPEAHKVCFKYKPAHSWLTAYAECLEVE